MRYSADNSESWILLNDSGSPFAEIADIIDNGKLDTLDDNISNEQEIKESNN